MHHDPAPPRAVVVGLATLGLLQVLATVAPAIAHAAMFNQTTAANAAMCSHLKKPNDLAMCRDACRAWPATSACLLVRRFGDLGTAVLVHAVKHKRSVVQVAREGKMTVAEGRALKLWADATGMRRVEWVATPRLDAQGQADVARALALRKQAVAAHQAHDGPGTLSRLREAYALFRKRLGAPHPHTFETAGQSAYTLLRQRKFKEASHALQRLLAQQQATYGNDHPHVAATLQLLGQVALGARRPAEARDLFGAALEVATPVWGAEHPKIRVMWNNLAFALNALGDDAGYEAAYRKSLAIARLVQGPAHADVATDLTNLGVLLSERGQYAEAERLLLEGIRIRTAHHAPADDLAGSYHNLGALKQLNGEYASARRYLEQAMALWPKGHDSHGLKRASTLLILGQVLQSLSDFQGAMIAFRKCKDLREKGLKRGDPDTALVYMQMGQLLDHIAARLPDGEERTKGLNQAQQLLNLAYTQTRRAQGATHPDTLRRLAALAGHYTSRQQPEKAVPLLREAVSGLAKRLGPGHPHVAGVWNNLGVALANSGDRDAALKAYRQAETLLVASVGGWHPDTQAVRVNIARLLLALGKVRAAMRAVDDASEQLLAQINASAAAASSDMALLHQVGDLGSLFNAAVSAHAAGRDARGGFAQVVRWQGAGTRVETLWRQLRRAEAAATPETRQLLRRYQTQQQALLIARGGAAAAATAALGRSGAAKAAPAARARPSAKTLAAEVAAIERQLAAQVPSLAVRSGHLHPTVKAVCAGLQRAKSSLVDYVSYARLPVAERRYAAFVVDPRGCKVRWVDLGSREAIDAAVKAWRAALNAATDCFVKRKNARFCGKTFRALDAAGQALRGQVWTPVAAAAGRAHRTWIVPAGALADVAFDALPDAKGRYLIEDRTLAYLPFPAAAARVRGSSSHAAKGAFVLGDLDYQRAQRSLSTAVAGWQVCTAAGCAVSASAAKEMNVALHTDAVSRGAAVCGRSASWGALPPTEAPAVARSLATRVADHVWLASGTAATERSVRGALPGRRFIHLATHGFFSDPKACGQPIDPLRIAKLLQRSVADGAAAPIVDPMAMSGVVLSGANAISSGASAANDGVLSAREVARMDLRGTELAVLSACETGLGVSGDGEGTLGLSRAFLVAGSAHTIVSLWQVPSAETTQLFTHFYAALVAGKHRGDVPAALRAARLHLLADLRARKLGASTFLWAAFVPFAAGL